MENLIKVDTGITTDYTTLGSYTYNFPKSYNKVLGVAINVYKTGTATTLENVYLTGFNNTSFSFVKDCVESPKANTASLNVTEWYVTLPSHIKKEKIISLSNMNQASCFEYCNLDLGANCIRVGSQGNASATNIKDIKVIVAYFT